MELKVIKMDIPDGSNLILGQSHFIKTVEDIYEVMTGIAPNAKFGIAFSEASGDCLVRKEGNDASLIEAATQNSLTLACGHTFVVLMKGAYPINVLNAIKAVQEVCAIFCATANPLQAVVAETEQGRGIMGVIDGFPPKGAEGPAQVEERRNLLRRFAYKL